MTMHKFLQEMKRQQMHKLLLDEENNIISVKNEDKKLKQQSKFIDHYRSN